MDPRTGLSSLSSAAGQRARPAPHGTGGERAVHPRRAIDLGCGTGRNTLFLAQPCFQVTGLDFTSSAIAMARQKADAAGLKAAMRGVEVLMESGLTPFVLILPEGEDPDSFVSKKSADALRESISNASPALDFVVDEKLDQLTGKFLDLLDVIA